MISIVYVTCPTLKAAETLSEALLKERLIGCANMLPQMKSLYHWEGRVESAEETVLLLKTAPEKVDALLKRVEELHPYDTPCALELKVDRGLEKYQEWILTETDSGKDT